MYMSPYQTYLLTNRGDKRPYKSILVKLNDMGSQISNNTVDISEIHTYEIYTCHPETGEEGWEIKLIRSTDRLIKSYPLFDTIIAKNDCPIENVNADWIDFNDLK